MGLELADLRVAILRGLEGFPHSFCGCDDDLVRAGSSYQAFAMRNAEEGCGRGGEVGPWCCEADFGLARNRKEAEKLSPRQLSDSVSKNLMEVAVF